MGFQRDMPLAQCATPRSLHVVPMPTADATLLLPPPFNDSDETPDDTGAMRAMPPPRHLDHVGVETVLGAMIEQKRRASQPAFPAYRAGRGIDDVECPDDAGGPPSERTGRAPTRSEVFLKAR